MKKYELTGETKEIGGVTLHRIRALIDIPEHDVKAGDLGGWIEAERNLSQKGAAWVADEAWVTGLSLVIGNALVMGNARAMGKARVTGLSLVAGNALVTGNAHIINTARVTGAALVTGNACVRGAAWVTGNAHIMNSADYITINTIKNCNDATTFYRGKDGGIYVACGRFSGSIDDFAAEVKQAHAGTKHEKTYLLAIALAKAQLGTTEEES